MDDDTPGDVPQFVIEKGVPLPPNPRGRREDSLHNVMSQMQPGDSVFVPKPLNSSVRGYVSVLQKRGFLFARRSVEGGTRVWCLEAPAARSAA